MVAEGLEQGDAWRMQRLQDLDLAEGIVRLGAVDDDLEGFVAGPGAEDLGGDAL